MFDNGLIIFLMNHFTVSSTKLTDIYSMLGINEIHSFFRKSVTALFGSSELREYFQRIPRPSERVKGFAFFFSGVWYPTKVISAGYPLLHRTNKLRI